MGPRELREFGALCPEGRKLLQAVGERLRLSARVYARVLRVARTIADLAGEAQVSRTHVSEALLYRCLDRPPC